MSKRQIKKVNPQLLLTLCILILFETPAIGMAKFKILHIDSYHAGYPWSDDIEKGIRKAIGQQTPIDKTANKIPINDVELRVIRMDTKLNSSEKFKMYCAKLYLESPNGRASCPLPVSSTQYHEDFRGMSVGQRPYTGTDRNI